MSNLPKGQSTEINGSRPNNVAGVYWHKEADKKIITAPGNDGNIQADALVQLGFQRVADLPSREELLNMQKKQEAADKAADAPATDEKTK